MINKLKEIQKKVNNLRVKVYSGQSLEDNDKDLLEIEIMLFKAMDDLRNKRNKSEVPSYLNNEYEITHLINDTYQVRVNGSVVYQGDENECNDYLKSMLGYE